MNFAQMLKILYTDELTSSINKKIFFYFILFIACNFSNEVSQETNYLHKTVHLEFKYITQAQ